MDQAVHDQMTHTQIIIDSDEHFSIDPISRSISNVSNRKVLLMQYDNNSERFSFDISRNIEGHDILNCNRVLINYCNTSAATRTRHNGIQTVTDLQVHPSDDTKATFTWLISEDSTHLAGSLSFSISFECVEGDTVLYRWNTAINSTISIVQCLNNGNEITSTYPDVLLEWENYIVETLDSQIAERTDAMETDMQEFVEDAYAEHVFATSEEVAALFSSVESSPSVSIVPFLIFNNIAVTTWADDETYEGYIYKAEISLTGVLASMFAQIVFGMTEAISGNYAPVCETYDGGVRIYSKVNTAISVPTILVNGGAL